MLQRWYSRDTGLWESTGWWNSANALTALIRYSQYTGDRSYLRVVKHTFVRAQRQKAGFINMFFDDCLWWALAWVAAFDLTGRKHYLRAAEAIFAHCLSAWDDTCGGGVWWNEERKYKNAITNELFLTLAGQLSQRIPANQDYRNWALRAWEWLRGSGMIGPSGLVNDGLTAACANNGGPTWTYNQGVILGGLAALHEITGDQELVRQGEVIADATLRFLVNPRGILTEPCEPSDCGADGTLFKGIFARHLHQFSQHSGNPAYRAFILANAEAVLRNAGNPAGQFGLCWGGPFDEADASRQTSAVEVLIAAAALTNQKLAERSRGSPAPPRFLHLRIARDSAGGLGPGTDVPLEHAWDGGRMNENHVHAAHDQQPPHGEQAWDERYRSKPEVWSGNPNAVLVAEAAGLQPGTALDAGAGEGGDAFWLAARGWKVTAADISSVAIERAAKRATERGLAITWLHADLAKVSAPGTYDLVTAHFLHVPKSDQQRLFRHLAAAVAPGGTLLVVGHDLSDIGKVPRPDLVEYGWAAQEVAAALSEGWTIETAEARPRQAVVDGDEVTIHDAVLRARRD